MLDEIIFLAISAVIIFAALKVVSSPEPVHAAIYLGLVLLGVAGIYLTVGAEFLAAVQILIYVGAVTTLILFAVMLTTHASPMEGFAEDRTPLAALGVDAPRGMDVEDVEEVPEDVETVAEAEQEADREGDAYTVRKDAEADEDEDEDDGAGEPTDQEDASHEAAGEEDLAEQDDDEQAQAPDEEVEEDRREASGEEAADDPGGVDDPAEDEADEDEAQGDR